jgi:hypothetical protein
LSDCCAVELPDQISRTHRHSLPCPQKEAAHLPPHLPSWRDRTSLLHSACWTHSCVLGSNHIELDCACGHVLVRAVLACSCSCLISSRYYFQSARGVKIWWKKYITIMQIVQFVIDLGFVYFASYTYFSNNYFPWAPNAGTCAGEEFAAFAGLIILSSYLLLFISFYFATYRKQTIQGRPRRNTGREALIAMKDLPLPDPNATGATIVVDEKSSNGAVATGRANGPTTRSRKA